MADEVDLQLESALNSLLNITEKKWELKERPQTGYCGFCKYIKEHIYESKKQCR